MLPAQFLFPQTLASRYFLQIKTGANWENGGSFILVTNRWSAVGLLQLAPRTMSPADGLSAPILAGGFVDLETNIARINRSLRWDWMTLQHAKISLHGVLVSQLCLFGMRHNMRLITRKRGAAVFSRPKGK